MSYLLLDEALELLDAAVDEGLHDHMAVWSVLEDGGNFSAVATSEGFVRLEDLLQSVRSAFLLYAREERLCVG